MIQDLQNLLFSSILNVQEIKWKIDELKTIFSAPKIDRQIILAFSLNYEKIPILLPFLSEPKIDEGAFFHYDHLLLSHLIENNISLPNSIFTHFHKSSNKNIIDKCLYDELKKKNKLYLLKGEPYEIRDKTQIEVVIERDQIDSFRSITGENTFDLNGTIKKINELYKYTEIPIILYCIEKMQ